MTNNINALFALSFIGGATFLFAILFLWYLVSEVLKKDKLTSKNVFPIPTPMEPEGALVLTADEVKYPDVVRSVETRRVEKPLVTETEDSLKTRLESLVAKLDDSSIRIIRRNGGGSETIVQFILGEAQMKIDGFNRSIQDKTLIKTYVPLFHINAAHIAFSAIIRELDGRDIHTYMPKIVKFVINNFGLRELKNTIRQASRYGYVRSATALVDYITTFFSEETWGGVRDERLLGLYPPSQNQLLRTRTEFESTMKQYILIDRYEIFLGRLAIEAATRNFDAAQDERLSHATNRKRRSSRIRQRSRRRP